MLLKRGSDRQLSKNFKEHELFCKSFNAPVEHYLDDNLIKAIQMLRDVTNEETYCTSSFRTPEEQAMLILNVVGAAKHSQHEEGRALDVKFKRLETLKHVQADILAKGPIYYRLRNLGINGFGIYDTFIHIDTRVGNRVHTDTIGTYAFWDNRKKKVISQPTSYQPIRKRTATQTNARTSLAQ